MNADHIQKFLAKKDDLTKGMVLKKWKRNKGPKPAAVKPSTIVLTVDIIAKKGKGKEVRELLRASRKPSRADKGCIYYDLHCPLEGEEFMFHEAWESDKLLKAHVESDHVKKLVEKMDPLLEKMSLNYWKFVK